MDGDCVVMLAPAMDFLRVHGAALLETAVLEKIIVTALQGAAGCDQTAGPVRWLRSHFRSFPTSPRHPVQAVGVAREAG
jgi:hypothetical protein